VGFGGQQRPAAAGEQLGRVVEGGDGGLGVTAGEVDVPARQRRQCGRDDGLGSLRDGLELIRGGRTGGDVTEP
jgi:hypothetical protein